MEDWQRVLNWVASGIFFCGLLALPAAAQQSADVQRAESSGQIATTAPAKILELPDSPGVLWSKAAVPSPQLGESESASGAQAAPQSGQSSANTSPTSDQTPQQKPVGTAAAEAPNASGVAASQPAGVAIAPAKQRRVRTIVLKTGAIIAAGVAVGSVVALTAGTSSKPPGAH